MTTIILHGHLKELYPAEIRVEANSAAEAIQSLALIPALRQPSGARHLVQVEGFESADALYDKREVDVLHIHPIMAGAGGGGWTQIIIGIVIIAVAIYAPGLLPTVLQSTAGLAAVTMAGAMMVLGGVLQLLAPQPSFSASNEERSRYLGNGRNTAAIGTRIPMLYGRRKQFGHYLSFDIDASTFDSAPAEWYSSPFTNYGELTNSAAPVDLPMDDPATAYFQPTSTFTGLSYPIDMTVAPETYIHFSAVQLTAGAWDISFATGHTLHVSVEADGMSTRAIILGGKTNNLPLVGTPIVFTQNNG